MVFFARGSQKEIEEWNGSRIVRTPLQYGGYESWFLRANHPERPLAFWIRYTLTRPPFDLFRAKGEIWAFLFDGERNSVIGIKESHPYIGSRFATNCLFVEIGDASLRPGEAEGRVSSEGHAIRWRLRYASSSPPLLLLPKPLYDLPFPRAKALVSAPMASFDGEIAVDQESWPIDSWVGSLNHNWGREHTPEYAWAQVAGFDNAKDAFLEVACARIQLSKRGSLLSPPLGAMVLRLGDREIRYSPFQISASFRSELNGLRWRFRLNTKAKGISGEIFAPHGHFVALTYDNPTGEKLTCLNSKIASASIRVEERGRLVEHLETAHRAAFELLSPAPPPPGIRPLVVKEKSGALGFGEDIA
ncbi:MAG: hypothetical protein NZM37_10095 [Sandaracinaceae bacterium]|nr:hypothetical protein [Sandaracinaceae bacterium]MDW8246676.1 hypothetical protein [Sandaracinaceae bacterium]